MSAPAAPSEQPTAHTPHHCERSFPICEETQERDPVMGALERVLTYKDADGAIGVIEFRSQLTDGWSPYPNRSRHMFVTEEGKPNFFGFAKDGALEATAIHRYTPDGKPVDDTYTINFVVDGTVTKCTYVGGLAQGLMRIYDAQEILKGFEVCKDGKPIAKFAPSATPIAVLQQENAAEMTVAQKLDVNDLYREAAIVMLAHGALNVARVTAVLGL